MAPNSLPPPSPPHSRRGPDSSGSSNRSKRKHSDPPHDHLPIAIAEIGVAAASPVTQPSPPPPPPPEIANSHTCDVCGKCFPSHQALGGHKSGHRNKTTSTAAATKIPSTARRNYACGPHPSGGLHECRMCKMSYATGQSLGGHMRKHYNGQIKLNRRRRNVENSPDDGSSSGGDSNSPPSGLDLTLQGWI